MTLDVQAHFLLSLLQGEDGKAWATDKHGWSSSGNQVPVCQWTGITCDNNELQGIDLSNTNLIASIPSELGMITTLRNVLLSDNFMHGSIPTSMADLPQLASLDLSINRIGGSLPAFTSPDLKHLSLRDNVLIGSIPSFFGQMQHSVLEKLDLSHNKLTGTLPSSIGLCSNMTSLILSENQLIGDIPLSLGDLPVLQQLHLDMNNLVGPILRTLAEDSSLSELWLQGNMLSGTVPEALTELPNLHHLYIDGNKLTGTIPEGLCQNLINFEFTDDTPATSDSASDSDTSSNLCARVACPVNTVSKEGVSPCQPCPKGFYSPYLGRDGECIDMNEQILLRQFWSVTHGSDWTGKNNWYFSGVNNVCNFTGVTCNRGNHIVALSLPNFGLKGRVPDALGYLRHLRILDLSDNNLTGLIPSDLRFASLGYLDLTGNKLNGVIPSKLCLVSGLNEIGSNGDYSCDRILCPVGTFNTRGRSGSGIPCVECHVDDYNFLGQKTCSALNYRSGLSVETSKSNVMLAGIVCAVLLSVAVLFILICFGKGEWWRLLCYRRSLYTKDQDRSNSPDGRSHGYLPSDHGEHSSKNPGKHDEQDYLQTAMFTNNKAKRKQWRLKKPTRREARSDRKKGTNVTYAAANVCEDDSEESDKSVEQDPDEAINYSNPLWLDVPKIGSAGMEMIRAKGGEII